MYARNLLASGLVIAVVASTCIAQTTFDKAVYLKAPAPGQKKGDTIKGVLVFDGAAKELQFVVSKGGLAAFNIKYDAVKSLLYERSAKPRYALGLLVAWPLLFTKSKKHYLTIHYTDPAGAGQFVIVQLDKSNFQVALATAEAETGKKVERVEER